jgi:hypothetical protein
MRFTDWFPSSNQIRITPIVIDLTELLFIGTILTHIGFFCFQVVGRVGTDVYGGITQIHSVQPGD